MKLKIGNKVYLQKYEVAFIMNYLSKFPASFLNETFSDANDGIFMMNALGDDTFDFKTVYEDPKNVAWLMEQTWLADFDIYSKMPLDELEESLERLESEYSARNAKLKAKGEGYSTEDVESLNKLGHKTNSLDYLVMFRRGKLNFIFPEGYECPKGIFKKPSFFARLFAKLFSRSAQ